ncbi:MAG: DUF2169 domain-containing protein [Minicystis sp.]
MPVSNHDMMIATTKTGHIARAYPGTDRCWNAPHNTVIFGDNYIDTKYLGTGKTTKTFIDEANIWTSVGLIDAAPSDPAHAGVGGGTESMTYRKEAAPTSYSKDVKFEGNGCVRTDDKTTQNHANTTGFVDGSNVKGQVDSAADYLKKKCVVDTLVGHCEHGRDLGAPPNGKTDEAFHLDVVGVDVVTLTVTRKDLIANKPSGCADHTYWTASRAGVGQGLSSRIDHLGDTFEVKGHILADPWTGAGALKTDENHDDKSTAQIGADPQSPKSPKTGDEKRYAERREATQSTLREYEQTTGKSSGWEKVNPLPAQTGKGNFMPQKAPTGPDVVQSVADKRTEEYNKSLDKARKQRAIATAIKDLEKAIAFWLIEREPPVVNITALACGGAKHVKLQVFPKDKISFDLFSEALNAKFQLIRDISKNRRVRLGEVRVLLEPQVPGEAQRQARCRLQGADPGQERLLQDAGPQGVDVQLPVRPLLRSSGEVHRPAPAALRRHGHARGGAGGQMAARQSRRRDQRLHRDQAGHQPVDLGDARPVQRRILQRAEVHADHRLLRRPRGEDRELGLGRAQGLCRGGHRARSVEVRAGAGPRAVRSDGRAPGRRERLRQGELVVHRGLRVVRLEAGGPQVPEGEGHHHQDHHLQHHREVTMRIVVVQPKSAVVSGAQAAPLPAVGVVRWSDPEPTLTVIVKATFSFALPGAATLAPDQLPLSLGEGLREGDPEVDYPSDFVPRKGAADVLLSGHAYADVPSDAIAGRLAVGPVERRFRGLAERPALRIPLRGAQIAGPSGEKAARVGAARRPLRPVAEGDFSPDEGPRYHTETFNYFAYNTAPPDQLSDWIAPDATVELSGLSVRGPVRFALPGLSPKVLVDALGAQTAVVDLACDTLWIDVDQEIGVMVWRGHVSVSSPRAPEVDRILVALDPHDEPLDAYEFRRRAMRSRLSFAAEEDRLSQEPAGDDESDRLTIARYELWSHEAAPDPELSLAQYAQISAELASGHETRNETLERYYLDEDTWTVEERAWLERMASAAASGDVGVAVEYGALFSAARKAIDAVAPAKLSTDGG